MRLGHYRVLIQNRPLPFKNVSLQSHRRSLKVSFRKKRKYRSKHRFLRQKEAFLRLGHYKVLIQNRPLPFKNILLRSHKRSLKVSCSEKIEISIFRPEESIESVCFLRLQSVAAKLHRMQKTASLYDVGKYELQKICIFFIFLRARARAPTRYTYM